MTFTPTPEQSAIRAHILSGKSSLLVSALAGSAKTTTIKYAAEGMTTPAIAVAFNAKIRDELKQALPSHFDVVTFNSAGHAAWGKYISKKLSVDARKTYRITDFMGRDDSRKVVMKLVDSAKALGLVPSGTPQKPTKVFTPDSPAGWYEVQKLAQIEELPPGAIDSALDALSRSISEGFEGRIDFNDQIFLTCCFGANFRTAPITFVDELQDISELNLFMLRKMTMKRAYGFGDEKQAIYAFRGAGTGMMARFRDTFSAVELPLTTCFRCSQAVVEEAKAYTPQMVPAPWAPPGSVKSLSTWGLDDIAPDSAVLCRNNAPLFSLGFSFLASGRPVNFHGKDLGWAIEKEITSIAGKGNNIFKTELVAGIEAKIARLPEDMRERLLDILEVVQAIPGEDTDSVRENLTELLSAPSGDVTLASIHGAKGLEWDKVYFLDRWRIPSKYAKTEEAKQQEFNLAYVGVTRAKQDLVWINMDGMKK